MVRQPLDQSAASAQLRQEVVGVRAADPLRGVRHFQDVTAQLRSEDRGFLPAFLPLLLRQTPSGPWCLATTWAVWIRGGLMEGLYCRGWPRRE